MTGDGGQGLGDGVPRPLTPDPYPPMIVHVKLYAGLRRFKPDVPLGASFACTLPKDLTLARLFEELKLPSGIVAIALVNGIAREREYVLREDDQVALWPPIAGG